MTSTDADDDAEASQPAEPRRRIRKGDREFMGISAIGWSITTNEVHSSMIGVTTGAIGGVAWIAGQPELTALLVIILGSYAILGRPIGASMLEDDHEYCSGSSSASIAIRTIRHEPWYFLIFMTVVLAALILVR